MHSDPKTLLILAAGMGSRYGGLKQLDKVGPKDESILDYSVYDAQRAGFNKIVFVIRHSFEEAFREKIVSRYENDMEVQLAFQELDDLPKGFSTPEGREKPWGTGHALWVAKDVIHEPFVVINADDYYGQEAFQTASIQLDVMADGKDKMAMVGYQLSKTLSDNGGVSRGVCQTEGGFLTQITETHGIRKENESIKCEAEHSDLREDSIVSMNFWIYHPDVFKCADEMLIDFLKHRGTEAKSEFYIPDLASQWMRLGHRIPVLNSSAQWIGVTYKEDREKVSEVIKEYHHQLIYPPALNHGIPDLEIASVFNKFQILGDLQHAIPYGSGHINQTYAITVHQGGSSLKYLLQRINTDVFKRPDQLMSNIQRVLDHAQQRLKESQDPDASRRAMTLIPARSGQPFALDAKGHAWRCYIFVEESTGHDIVETTEQAYEAAHAFGEFQNLMSDLPGEPLFETIPDFHNTPKRYKDLEDAIKADTCDRAQHVQDEIDFFTSRKDMTQHLLNLVDQGEIPWRVTHNDTKLNNVLLDNVTQKAVCVIDLDTTMPGLSLYDFGDLVRTSTSPAAEDETDLSLVQCRPTMFQALVEGYLDSAMEVMTPSEIQHLVFSGRLITYEVGLRFLTDYLNGDQYFRVKRDGHNLDRCRTQIALIRSIEEEEKEHELSTIVEQAVSKRKK